jgi:hypothetical protein
MAGLRFKEGDAGEPTPEQAIALATPRGDAEHLFNHNFEAEDFLLSTEVYCRLLTAANEEINAGADSRHVAIGIVTLAIMPEKGDFI